MIKEVKMYGGCCDNCGKDYYDEHSGFSAMSSESSISELMDNDNWYSQDDKYYCPDCYSIDNDDNLIIQTITT